MILRDIEKIIGRNLLDSSLGENLVGTVLKKMLHSPARFANYFFGHSDRYICMSEYKSYMWQFAIEKFISFNYSVDKVPFIMDLKHKIK